MKTIIIVALIGLIIASGSADSVLSTAKRFWGEVQNAPAVQANGAKAVEEVKKALPEIQNKVLEASDQLGREVKKTAEDAKR